MISEKENVGKITLIRVSNGPLMGPKESQDAWGPSLNPLLFFLFSFSANRLKNPPFCNFTVPLFSLPWLTLHFYLSSSSLSSSPFPPPPTPSGSTTAPSPTISLPLPRSPPSSNLTPTSTASRSLTPTPIFSAPSPAPASPSPSP